MKEPGQDPDVDGEGCPICRIGKLARFECLTCKNCFYIENLPMQVIRWCPFCGIEFRSMEFVAEGTPKVK